MTGQVAPMVASSWIEKLGGDSMRVAFRIPPALGVGAGFAVEKGRSARNAQTKSLNLRLFIREPPRGEIVGIEESLSECYLLCQIRISTSHPIGSPRDTNADDNIFV